MIESARILRRSCQTANTLVKTVTTPVTFHNRMLREHSQMTSKRETQKLTATRSHESNSAEYQDTLPYLGSVGCPERRVTLRSPADCPLQSRERQVFDSRRKRHSLCAVRSSEL